MFEPRNEPVEVEDLKIGLRKHLPLLGRYWPTWLGGHWLSVDCWVVTLAELFSSWAQLSNGAEFLFACRGWVLGIPFSPGFILICPYSLGPLGQCQVYPSVALIDEIHLRWRWAAVWGCGLWLWKADGCMWTKVWSWNHQPAVCTQEMN